MSYKVNMTKVMQHLRKPFEPAPFRCCVGCWKPLPDSGRLELLCADCAGLTLEDLGAGTLDAFIGEINSRVA